MIEFVIPGEAVAQGRPRASAANGTVRMYDPKKSRDFKQFVSLIASQNAPASLLEGELALRVKIYRPIPKSFSKKKTALAESGTLRPISKPDVDNYVKGVKDGCNKIIWKDDSQIVDLHVSKFYSNKPRVEVQVTSVAGGGEE